MNAKLTRCLILAGFLIIHSQALAQETLRHYTLPDEPHQVVLI